MMDEQTPIETQRIDPDVILRGLALEWVRALILTIDVGMAVFANPLRYLRIDDDLRMVRQVLVRVTGKG
jgi:hypothetical protein